MKEIWKDVVGYEGRYMVSNKGRVLSLPKTVRNGTGWITRRKKIMGASPDGCGHVHTLLRKNGKSKLHPIHRLVLEAFVGPCPAGMEARHFPDRNPSNNNLCNLQWGTKKEQFQDRVVHGTVLYGEKSPNAKLTYEKVTKAKQLRVKGWTFEKIANLFKVNPRTIYSAIKGKQWKHHTHQENLATGEIIEI